MILPDNRQINFAACCCMLQRCCCRRRRWSMADHPHSPCSVTKHIHLPFFLFFSLFSSFCLSSVGPASTPILEFRDKRGDRIVCRSSTLGTFCKVPCFSFLILKEEKLFCSSSLDRKSVSIFFLASSNLYACCIGANTHALMKMDPRLRANIVLVCL